MLIIHFVLRLLVSIIALVNLITFLESKCGTKKCNYYNDMQRWLIHKEKNDYVGVDITTFDY